MRGLDRVLGWAYSAVLHALTTAIGATKIPRNGGHSLSPAKQADQISNGDEASIMGRHSGGSVLGCCCYCA
jgi:hypothetical protein